ncbi:hypothetical protein K9N68_21940 [Kovacikia minuta CCNUW1]|uniref:Cas10/Cmr2 second palm domain-containing protein n=1 Tax=Kovacikia minuta TaxID=2931930 RepID=UPI001CCA02BA|nr:type III-B CRISPR-associated protein Cas10/Cmr2 [Kovacikia minuta]UBF24353.1 hypothetical protein K9N68_21940 [Kovacikia minuta CCNUW1]
MPDAITCYTAITFAPVQGFIEKSRKLRDLYGSSFILSYLANALCQAVKDSTEHSLISPALIDVTQGTPNQILIAGYFPEQQAQTIFETAWSQLIQQCKAWIQQNLPEFDYCWRREWSLWTTHAWEFFWTTGMTIQAARENLNDVKHSRDWTGINWMGESSTLSGADGVAFPGMGRKVNPKYHPIRYESDKVRRYYENLSRRDGETQFTDETNIDAFLRSEIAAFYAALSQHPELGSATISEREQLSIPELVKRLVTIEAIARPLKLEFPESFKDISRWQDYDANDTNADTKKPWTGWFCGDGDRAGDYLKQLSGQPNEPLEIATFSTTMRQWGNTLQRTFRNGRIIYAGGDDFLGVFNRTRSELKAQECLDWFYRFQPNVWDRPEAKPITASVGFVWAAPGIPQREVLQQCRDAEKAAKAEGRDRLALRVLFNSGNYLEWVCPWRFLPVLQDYRDRTPQNGTTTWARIFNDVAMLEARHAFQGKDDKGKPVNNGLEVALALFNAYFNATNSPHTPTAWNEADKQEFYCLMSPERQDNFPPNYWEGDGLWNLYGGANRYDAKNSQRLKTGILGDRANYTSNRQSDGILDTAKAKQALTNWIINLAKVGFHLCSDI